MAKARRTEAAECDLQDIAFHIALAQRRPVIADRVIDEILAQTDRLAALSRNAELGTLAPEIGEGVRLFSFKRWVILFRYEQHGIDVLRIADGSQDYLAWKLG